MHLRKSYLLLTLAAAAACSADTVLTPDASPAAAALKSTAGPGKFLVTFKSTQVPAEFADRVAAVGGSIDLAAASAGVVVVDGLDPAGISALAAAGDIVAVEQDEEFSLEEPSITAVESSFEVADLQGPTVEATVLPTAAAIYGRQWSYRAVDAERAWKAGFVGSKSTKVAILDSGIDGGNIDLIGLVDPKLSKSFVKTDAVLVDMYFKGKTFPEWQDFNGHGTHVASTVASRGLLVAGMTQNVTLIAVKVMNARGSGSLSAIANGLVYAADNGAAVVNMSIGGYHLKNEDKGLHVALRRIADYALDRGTTIVVAAGNESVDLQHTAHIGLPTLFADWCDVQNVICVAATGSTGSLNLAAPLGDNDEFATYSNYGSSVDVAAPGGNYRVDAAGKLLGASVIWQACSRTQLSYKGKDEDPTDYKLFAPTNCTKPGYYVLFELGTSMASPHVAGAAALLVDKYGRDPQAIRSAIEKSADDRGKPGEDAFYGKGRLNVARALGL